MLRFRSREEQGCPTLVTAPLGSGPVLAVRSEAWCWWCWLPAHWREGFHEEISNSKLEAAALSEREITSLRCWPWKSPVLSAILYWKMAGFAKWQIGQETILIYFSPSDHLSKFISKRKFYLPFFIILTTSQVRQRNPRMLQFSLGKSNYGSWYYQQKAPLSIKCMSPVGLVNLLWIWLGKDRDPLAFFICWGLRFLSLLFPFLIFLVGLPFEFANTIHSLDF